MKIKIRIDSYKMIPAFILAAVIFVFVAGNSDNPDMFATQYYYNNGLITADAIIPSLLQQFSLRIGFNVYQFRIVCYFIGFIFMLLGLKRCNTSAIAFWALYAIYPMMLDAVQTDNFVAMAVLFYALTYCDDEEIRHNKIRMIVWMIVAAGFHTAFIAYIPFVFTYGVFEKRNFRLIAIVVIIGSIFATIFRSRIIGILTILFNYVLKGDLRISSYLSGTGHLGFLLFWSIHIAFMLIVFAADYYSIDDVGRHNNRIVDIAKRIMIYSILFFPLYAINSNFFRLTRNLIPIVLVAVLQKPYKERNNRRYLNIACVIIPLVVLLYIDVLSSNYESIFMTFFSKNYIIWGNH